MNRRGEKPLFSSVGGKIKRDLIKLTQTSSTSSYGACQTKILWHLKHKKGLGQEA